MKVIALTLFVLSLPAKASYIATFCSNSTGTVKWETGHNENTINLKYSNFIEGTLTLDINQVQIDYKRKITVTEKKIRNCGFSADNKVYAAEVRIGPGADHPDVLIGQFPENKVETEVICTSHINSFSPCL